jgi:Uma2 family endonuclease
MNEAPETVIELPEGLSALPPTQDDLECSDGEPMESEFHVWQMHLLIRPLVWHFANEPVYAVGNMFVYFSPDQVKNEHFKGPDVFVVKGVSKEFRKCWVVWQEGKGPDVVIELLSDSTRREDKVHKKEIYERRLRVPEYFWFDPQRPEDFAGFHLVNGRYEPIVPDGQGRLVCRQLDLLLAPWFGRHPLVQAPRTWLRWLTLEGVPLPTEDENAERERERVRALEAKLRALGFDPD